MSQKKLPEDSHLFRSAIGHVQPVKADKVLFVADNKPKPYPRTRTVHAEEALSDGVGDYDITTVGQEDALSFAAFGAPKNALKHMRQGYFGIDAEIDLHGLTSQDAKKYLLSFLRDCVIDGCQCVHIVHGKGYHSQDNHPVLKNNLNLWLRQHRDVQAFCSAAPKDGGTGALLVLLYLSEKYQK